MKKFIFCLSLFINIIFAQFAYSNTYAYPVPWVPEGGKPDRYGTRADGIRFANVPSSGTITIYTTAGSVAKTINIASEKNPGEDFVRWYGKNNDYSETASGVYIWVLDAPGIKQTGKLVIIR